MSPERVIEFIENPESLSEENVVDLTLIADQYPYFQTAQLLRIKSLQKISPDGIEPVLNFTAAYVTNRKVLYYLLHPLQNQEETEGLQYVEKDFKDSLVENISDTLTNQLSYSDNLPDSELDFTSSMDIRKEYGQDVALKDYVVRITDDGPELMELIKDEEPEIQTTKKVKVSENSDDLLLLIKKGAEIDTEADSDSLSENQKKHNELIENFITLNPKIVPEATAKKNVDVSEESVQENEHYLTDTLAQIYLRQGNYAKAIFAYEKLSLKFPEKSTYFAGQIAEIKRIINNTK